MKCQTDCKKYKTNILVPFEQFVSSNFSPNNYFDYFQNDHRQGMMEFVENSDKALAALEKRDAAKQQSNEVKTTMTMIVV